MSDDIDEIKRRLTDNLEGVIGKFWPSWERRGDTAYPIPGKRGDLGSFVVYLGPVLKYTRGQWFRSSQNIGGYVLNLFAYGDSGNHRATASTFKRAREFVGLDGAVPDTEEERTQRLRNEAKEASRRKAAEEKQAADRARKLETAAGIWDDAVPIAGTHAEAYLIARLGMKPKGGWPDVLRFHPRLPYSSPDGTTKPGTFYPALVCKVTDMLDEFTAVWRIFLHPTKPQKAPVGKAAKMGLGQAGGGAIRLGGIGPIIGVAEGVESALGAFLYSSEKYPVWSAMSTSGMAGLQVPFEIERVYIFPDGDKPMRRVSGHGSEEYKVAVPAGRQAANDLLKSLGSIGRKKPEPKAGQDYCDMWRDKLERITWG